MPPGSTKAEVWNTPAHPSKARCRLSGSITLAITVHTPSLPSSPNISISRSLSMSSANNSTHGTPGPCQTSWSENQIIETLDNTAKQKSYQSACISFGFLCTPIGSQIEQWDLVRYQTARGHTRRASEIGCGLIDRVLRMAPIQQRCRLR